LSVNIEELWCRHIDGDDMSADDVDKLHETLEADADLREELLADEGMVGMLAAFFDAERSEDAFVSEWRGHMDAHATEDAFVRGVLNRTKRRTALTGLAATVAWIVASLAAAATLVSLVHFGVVGGKKKRTDPAPLTQPAVATAPYDIKEEGTPPAGGFILKDSFDEGLKNWEIVSGPVVSMGKQGKMPDDCGFAAVTDAAESHVELTESHGGAVVIRKDSYDGRYVGIRLKKAITASSFSISFRFRYETAGLIVRTALLEPRPGVEYEFSTVGGVAVPATTRVWHSMRAEYAWSTDSKGRRLDVRKMRDGRIREEVAYRGMDSCTAVICIAKGEMILDDVTICSPPRKADE